jgi:hypothetical protein
MAKAYRRVLVTWWISWVLMMAWRFAICWQDRRTTSRDVPPMLVTASNTIQDVSKLKLMTIGCKSRMLYCDMLSEANANAEGGGSVPDPVGVLVQKDIRNHQVAIYNPRCCISQTPFQQVHRPISTSGTTSTTIMSVRHFRDLKKREVCLI